MCKRHDLFFLSNRRCLKNSTGDRNTETTCMCIDETDILQKAQTQHTVKYLNNAAYKYVVFYFNISYIVSD